MIGLSVQVRPIYTERDMSGGVVPGMDMRSATAAGSKHAVHRNFFDGYASADPTDATTVKPATDDTKQSAGAGTGTAVTAVTATASTNAKEALITTIRNSLIGSDEAITTPFGVRYVIG